MEDGWNSGTELQSAERLSRRLVRTLEGFVRRKSATEIDDAEESKHAVICDFE